MVQSSVKQDSGIAYVYSFWDTLYIHIDGLAQLQFLWNTVCNFVTPSLSFQCYENDTNCLHIIPVIVSLGEVSNWTLCNSNELTSWWKLQLIVNWLLCSLVHDYETNNEELWIEKFLYSPGGPEKSAKFSSTRSCAATEISTECLRNTSLAASDNLFGNPLWRSVQFRR
jgi:hypothetical protein